jgi:hypothetical protein
LIFPLVFSVVAKLTGEFTSLEEPTDDPDAVSDCPGFACRRIRFHRI